MTSRSALLALLATFLASTSAIPTHTGKLDTRAYSVYTKCKNEGDFALTFDDGLFKYEREIVSHLNSGGALGTFFINGNNFDCIYDEADSLREAFDAGHIIASHTWSHSDITTLSEQDLNEELNRLEVAMKKILGVKPRLFRPPYGNYNDESLRVLSNRGYSTVTWSMDSGDSLGKSESYSEGEYRKQAKQYPQPGIGLNHETEQTTANDLVPKAIDILKGAGYRLVSVSDCLDVEPYEYVGGRTERDNSWTC